MECKFNKERTGDYSIVILDGQEILMSSHFRYLDFIIQKDGEINSDVNLGFKPRLVEMEECNRTFMRPQHSVMAERKILSDYY